MAAVTASEDSGTFPAVLLPTAVLYDERLSDSSKILWALLYQYAQTHGSASFEMTTEQMMSLSGAAKASVVKRRKELVAAGWLSEQVLRGLARTNLYTVRTPADPVPAQ